MSNTFLRIKILLYIFKKKKKKRSEQSTDLNPIEMHFYP